MLVAACVTLPADRPPAASTPHFSAQAFFAGATEGDGLLKIALKPRRHVRVLGHGGILADGTLVLEQTVTVVGEAPVHREWRIREVAPGRYAGSLTDAAGPVEGIVDGNLLRLNFRMKHGLDAEQRLYLAAGGGIAHNLMMIRKFGIVVATLDETIRKVG